jgi:hypothetical protein
MASATLRASLVKTGACVYMLGSTVAVLAAPADRLVDALIGVADQGPVGHTDQAFGDVTAVDLLDHHVRQNHSAASSIPIDGTTLARVVGQQWMHASTLISCQSGATSWASSGWSVVRSNRI